VSGPVIAADAPTAAATAPAPVAPAAAAPNDGLAPAAANATGEIDNSTATTFDYLFNHKGKEGTAAKATSDVASALADKIKAVDVLKTPGLDDPQVRARFETYLSLKEVPDSRIKEYFAKMSEVSELLKQGDAFAAWKDLYAMSEYKDLDAGISRELANRVEAVWNTARTKNGLDLADDKLRSNIEGYVHNSDMIAEDLHEQALDEANKANSTHSSTDSSSGSNGSSGSNTTNSSASALDPATAEAALMPSMAGNLQGKMEMTSEYIKQLEARWKINLNELRESRISDQAKSDFASYIKTLYDTHRYYHVIIAADFWRALFNEGDYPVDMADEINASLETNERVTQAIEVFKYKADQNQIAAAADQLQEAFVANEFHPGLQGLARADKEKVGDFVGKLDVLKNQLEARDFEQVEQQIADIKKVAVDFDSTKPLALVNGVKLESRLRLGKAKLLAQGGHLTESMAEFQTAAEEWPGNPDLQKSANGFFSTEDVQNQSTSDFDRLIDEKNYREIYDKQLAFAPAVKGDATREQELKDALIKVQKAEMASEKANLLVMNGDFDGAWETIETAAKDWPDDTKLNRLLADLSGRSADFVSAINRARDAEAKKEMGYSLTWYVNAQNDYPASQIANDGIQRVSQLLLQAPAGGGSAKE
jgi:hypothetical protein